MKVVVFTSNNARVIYTDNPEQFSGNVLIEPEIPMGVAPHYWKIVDGHIEPMTENERIARDLDIERNGVDNNVHGSAPEVIIPKKGLSKIHWIGLGLGAAAAGAMALHYLKG